MLIVYLKYGWFLIKLILKTYFCLSVILLITCFEFIKHI